MVRTTANQHLQSNQNSLIQYQIPVIHNENNTMSRMLITDIAITDRGIKITILEAYVQLQLPIQDKLI